MHLLAPHVYKVALAQEMIASWGNKSSSSQSTTLQRMSNIFSAFTMRQCSHSICHCAARPLKRRYRDLHQRRSFILFMLRACAKHSPTQGAVEGALSLMRQAEGAVSNYSGSPGPGKWSKITTEMAIAGGAFPKYSTSRPRRMPRERAGSSLRSIRILLSASIHASCFSESEGWRHYTVDPTSPCRSTARAVYPDMGPGFPLDTPSWTCQWCRTRPV